MNEMNVIAALDMPTNARVDRRVPKKLLVENGAATSADKRKINESIEEVYWLASLKPTTTGIPEFCDNTREYLEIAVLRVVFRTTAHITRLVELIHRAIPYPVFLIAKQSKEPTISLAHKRRSQAEAGATVLDGALVVAEPAALDSDAGIAFFSEVAVAKQPQTNLFTLYQGWIDTMVALLAAQVTGTFTVASSPEIAAARRTALAECERLDAQLAKVRAAAGKERQVARQVALNLEMNRMKAEHSAAQANL